MSHSYKKHSISKTGHRCNKSYKRHSNDKVRSMSRVSLESVPDGGAYKKICDSSGIYGKERIMTEEDAIEMYNRIISSDAFSRSVGFSDVNDFTKKYPTLESYLKKWRKEYLRK